MNSALLTKSLSITVGTVVYTDIHKWSPCGWILYSDFEINQGARGCSREAAQQRLDRCERAPAAQASWAGPSEVS